MVNGLFRPPVLPFIYPPPQVHDEVILEGPKETAEQVRAAHGKRLLPIHGKTPAAKHGLLNTAAPPPRLLPCPLNDPAAVPPSPLPRRASVWWRACAAPSRASAPSRYWLTWWWTPSTQTRGTRQSRASTRAAWTTNQHS